MKFLQSKFLKFLYLPKMSIFYSQRKHFIYFPEKKFPMLCQKKTKNISNEINYQNENDHANYNKVFFLILQYFFLYSTSLCFSFSESFLDCSWPYCPFFSFSFFVIIWCFQVCSCCLSLLSREYFWSILWRFYICK